VRLLRYEAVTFATPELERVPQFQEQVMQVSMVCAGISAGEADQLGAPWLPSSTPEASRNSARS
jgi:hypothetical protein